MAKYNQEKIKTREAYYSWFRLEFYSSSLALFFGFILSHIFIYKDLDLRELSWFALVVLVIVLVVVGLVALLHSYLWTRKSNRKSDLSTVKYNFGKTIYASVIYIVVAYIAFSKKLTGPRSNILDPDTHFLGRGFIFNHSQEDGKNAFITVVIICLMYLAFNYLALQLKSKKVK